MVAALASKGPVFPSSVEGPRFCIVYLPIVADDLLHTNVDLLHEERLLI